MAANIYPNGAALILAGALATRFGSTTLKLLKSPVTLTRFLTLADLTEADFSGYAAKSITAVGTPILNANAGADIPIPSQEFTVTTATPQVGNDIYGWWLEDGSSNLLALAVFDSPVPMQFVGQGLVLLSLMNFFGADPIYVSVNGQPA